MRYLTGHYEIKQMITYEDIQKAAIEVENKRVDYLDKYRAMIANFLMAFEESLGISNKKKFRNFEGQEQNLVTLGIFEQDEFKFRPAYAMDFSPDYTVPFYVKIVVDTTDPSAPWIAVKCSILRRDGRDCVSIHAPNEEPKICRIADGDTLDRYSVAAETLKSTILNLIKTETPF